MEYKPKFKNFITKKIISDKEYLVFQDRSTGTLYKEVNGFSTRIKYEIVFCLIPLVWLIIYKLTSDMFVWKTDYLDFQNIVYLFVLALLPLRYFIVKFTKITNMTEGRDCRIRIIELIIVILAIIISSYVNHMIILDIITA